MQRGPRYVRQAFTLIELLVTITVATILIAMALPLVKFSIEEGRTREASRQFNAFLARAKAQAAYEQRPIGVMIVRDPNDSTGGTATKCFLAEIPPPFGGAMLDSKVQVANSGQLTFVVSGNQPDLSTSGMLKAFFPNGAGFGIRLDYKGSVFVGYATPGGTAPSLMITDPAFANLMAQGGFNTSQSFSYQIYRLPQKISNISLELPKGTFMSLANSGSGSSGTEFSAAASDKVSVMFAPSGAVSSVDFTGTSIVPNGTIHFLIARLRTETSPPPFLNDSNNYWVSIGHLTGTVATSETGFDSSGDGNVTVSESRYYAIRYDQSGGR